MTGLAKDKNGADAIFLNHMEDYDEGVLQSTNIIAIVELDEGQKEYKLEKFFITMCRWHLQCSNALSDSETTETGFYSNYIAVYVVQNLPFYKMIMLRWTITVEINDFIAYSKMYAISLTFSQLGTANFPCLECLEFYEGKKYCHYHNFDGTALGCMIAITENLELTGKYAEPAFSDKFYILNAKINASNDMQSIGESHAAGFERKINRDKLGPHRYPRKSCTFSTLSKLKELYEGTNYSIAAKYDMKRNIVDGTRYVQIDIGIVETYFKRLCIGYEPLFRIP